MARQGWIPRLTTHGTPPAKNQVERYESSDKEERDEGVFRNVEDHQTALEDPNDHAPTQDANAVIYNAADKLSPNSEFGGYMYYREC